MLDALYILQYEIGTRDAHNGCPLPISDTLNVDSCDVNLDDSCDAIDGLFVLMCDAGINNTLCPASNSTRIGRKLAAAEGITIKIGDGALLSNEAVDLPISAELSDGVGLAATSLEIQYNPFEIEILDCTVADDFVGSCNITYESDGGSTDIVRLSIASAAGQSGTVELGTLSIKSAEGVHTSSTLTAHAPILSDTDGETTQLEPQESIISAQGGTVTAVTVSAQSTQSSYPWLVLSTVTLLIATTAAIVYRRHLT